MHYIARDFFLDNGKGGHYSPPPVNEFVQSKRILIFESFLVNYGSSSLPEPFDSLLILIEEQKTPSHEKMVSLSQINRLLMAGS
jgi:hypothetical protein